MHEKYDKIITGMKKKLISFLLMFRTLRIILIEIFSLITIIE